MGVEEGSILVCTCNFTYIMYWDIWIQIYITNTSGGGGGGGMDCEREVSKKR